jgi:UDP-N-acetylmuramate--alanine ligase
MSSGSDDAIRKALAGFGGVKRRFTRTGEWNGVTIIDDYGHHPVEIAAVLKAARDSTQGQGHRRRAAASLYAPAVAVRGILHLLQRRRHVIVADVYAAGEAPIRASTAIPGAAGMRARGHREVIAAAAAKQVASARCGIAKPGDYRGLPRRRQHHAVGLCAAGRAKGAGVNA